MVVVRKPVGERWLTACLDIQNQQPNEGPLAFDFPLVSMLAEPLYWNI